jgi:hypothetical protein
LSGHGRYGWLAGQYHRPLQTVHEDPEGGRQPGADPLPASELLPDDLASAVPASSRALARIDPPHPAVQSHPAVPNSTIRLAAFVAEATSTRVAERGMRGV